jgi:capsular exopolysaccharide synthesis family protein
MSKFAKALEQAERDHHLRQRARATDHSGSGPAEMSDPEAGPQTVPCTAEDPFSSPGPPQGRDEAGRGAGVDERLVSLLDPNAFEAEQYRALRHAVEEAHRRTGLSVLAISSPGVRDGKTTTAINLAGALAQAPDVRVLLIDADLRRPSIAGRIGLFGPVGPALPNLVLDPALSLDDVARWRPPFNLALIPAGSASVNSYELFKAPRLGDLLAEARRRFDYIIIDTPPLLHVPDSRIIGRWVDAYLIVVACHVTPRKLLAEALNMMEPEKVAGLVFNGEDGRLTDSRYYRYAYAPLPGGQKTRGLTRVPRPWGRRRSSP